MLVAHAKCSPVRPCWCKMAAGTDSRKSRKSESQNEEEEEMEMEEEPDFSDPEGFVDDITDEGKFLCIFTFIPLCGTSYVAYFCERTGLFSGQIPRPFAV